jgi:hypothetical protein
MIDSDINTLLPSLIQFVKSDLFTFDNIAKSISVTNKKDERDGNNLPIGDWAVVIQFLPLEFYHIIESWPNIYTLEKFDNRYICNPKKCAYDKYETTNMWRPLMILNNCPTISRFKFDYIKYYDPEIFSEVLSLLIARVRKYDQQSSY